MTLKETREKLEHKRTVRLETISDIYDVPLNTLRKWASRREFPGIIKRRGARRLYIDIAKFDRWFRGGER
jgi:hypothetical protein